MAPGERQRIPTTLRRWTSDTAHGSVFPGLACRSGMATASRFYQALAGDASLPRLENAFPQRAHERHRVPNPFVLRNPFHVLTLLQKIGAVLSHDVLNPTHVAS